MFELLSPNQRLDFILVFFKMRNEHFTVEEMCKKYEEIGNPINIDDIILCIDKLVKDGYITERINFNTSSYKINHDGYLFYGYVKQKENLDLLSSIAYKNEGEAKSYQNRLLLGTWFAGIVALLLLLWQIFLYLYPVHKDYPYWIWEK